HQLETVAGISRKVASDIKSEYDPDKAQESAARVMQLGWTVSFLGEPGYPDLLSKISSAPPLLFSVGTPLEKNESSIAIVGTRKASEQGRSFTFKLAAELARAGITVISGMADGIDSAAHKGALEAGGRTIAVWGSSLDIVYPPTNKGLAEKIKENGAVYSEYLPGTAPDRASFPERNRIISGLSSGVVVIEAGQKSGALLTAGHALDQSRELFAVPGHPESRGSLGTNSLIKKGARLLTSVEDIFEELPRLKREIIARKFVELPDMTDTERKIVDLFVDGPIQLDKISRSVQLPVSETLEFMLALELKGVVRELSGKRFVLTEDFA
ncbi:MAG: DNA-processing protein DprA, partial [bacterium]|nr:DNA-processing protein DprA [bacterium]